MRAFLVEVVDLAGRVVSAAEYSDGGPAVRAAALTFQKRGGDVRRVDVRDADGVIVYARLIAARPKGIR